MKAYSIDLRQRAIDAYDAREGTQEQVAARFAVSTSGVYKLLHQRRPPDRSTRSRTAAATPRPSTPPPGPSSARPSATTPTPRSRSWAAPPAWRAAPRPSSGAGPAGDHAKKKSRRAAEQDRPELKAERAAWREEFAAIDPARLVFIDETGASTAMDRTFGRAPPGCGSTARCRTATGRSRR